MIRKRSIPFDEAFADDARFIEALRRAALDAARRRAGCHVNDGPAGDGRRTIGTLAQGCAE